MDQIQQNIIKPTNHKKNGEAIFVGIFEIGLENEGGELQGVNQRGSNPR